MNTISPEMNAESATTIEGALQLYADTVALLADVQALSVRRADGFPQGISLEGEAELYDQTNRALHADAVRGVLDAIASTIATYYANVGELDDRAVGLQMARALLALTDLSPTGEVSERAMRAALGFGN